MFTKSQNRIGSLYIILLLIIPQTIHIMARKFVFQAIPGPKLRCSRLKFKAFQVYSKPFQVLFQVCSKVYSPFCLSFFQKLNLLEHFPKSLILLPSFAQAFSKGLILPFAQAFSKSLIQVREKLHQNYTKITPILA